MIFISCFLDRNYERILDAVLHSSTTFVSVKFIYAILWIDLIDSFAKKSPELECQA